MTEPTLLDWRGDTWRVLPANYWPRLTRPGHGRRPAVLGPATPPPACRHCGHPAHLLDDDHQPAHKICVEAKEHRP